MNIGIDIDDTIANTFEVMFAYSQKYTAEDLKRSDKIIELEDIKTHFYCQAMHSWSKEEEIEFFKKYYEKILIETKPFTCSIETLEELRKLGHKIILITARFEVSSFDVKELTIKWLKKYNVPYDKLIINASTKVEAVLKNSIDIFVDDSYKNCKEVSDAGIKSLIMDTKCNRGIKDEKIERVYSWPHIKQIIDREYGLKNNN